jgi:hypothetical protein
MALALPAIMMDRTRAGSRCRTIRSIVHHVGLIPRETTGTIRYETENIGRRLMRVDLDSGLGVMLLADDVAIEAARDG